MNLHVLGSGSSGNCYILENQNEALVIEAGVSFLEVKKAVDFNIAKIKAVIVSHDHGDHAKELRHYKKYGIPFWKPKHGLLPTAIHFGWFSILARQVYHDIPNFCFYISHPDFGNLAYITDTNEVPYLFEEMNHILIETNYCEDIIIEKILAGNLFAGLGARIKESHMSIQTAEKWLVSNDLSGVHNIILCHLSNGNSDSVRFQTRIQRATGKPVRVAVKGMEIKL